MPFHSLEEGNRLLGHLQAGGTPAELADRKIHCFRKGERFNQNIVLEKTNSGYGSVMHVVALLDIKKSTYSPSRSSNIRNIHLGRPTTACRAILFT